MQSQPIKQSKLKISLLPILNKSNLDGKASTITYFHPKKCVCLIKNPRCVQSGTYKRTHHHAGVTRAQASPNTEQTKKDPIHYKQYSS